MYSGRSGSQILETNLEIATWEARVVSVTFHPSGDLFASSHQDGVIRLWSTSDGAVLDEIGTFEHLKGTRFRDRALRFSSSGRELYLLREINTGFLDGLSLSFS